MARKKILVVDDSPTALLWQQMLLRNEPFDIITATDGDEGVRVAHAEHPDLVLLDVVMPRMNGFDACRAMRLDPDLRDIPIFLVTTRSEMNSVTAGYESGCTEFVTKPIDKVELLAKIHSYLPLGGVA